MPGRYSRLPKGEGEQIVVPIADPGAGNEWSYTVLAGQIVRVDALCCRFTASVVAGNRTAGLCYRDGGAGILTLQFAAAQAAAQDYRNSYYIGASDNGQTVRGSSNNHVDSLPRLRLTAGCVIGSLTQIGAGGMDAGDQYREIRLNLTIWRV